MKDMNTQKVYLKQNVQLEPLFNQWYAWPYLISPATAAMYVVNSHLKIMQSFVANPQFHVSALKNPLMRGGPFINYEASRAREVKALLEKTTREQSHMLELAAAVRELDALLESEGDGNSLEPLYAKVPDCLRGYVELVYDQNNHASARFIEGLLYRSRFYNEASQSIRLSLVEQDERPFALSTPVLEDGRALRTQMPFSSAKIDELFKMKYAPQTLGYAEELFGVTPDGHEIFQTFFTDEAPPPPPKYEGEGVRVRYYGHACILIETEEVSILTDPVISYKYEGGIPRYTFADLPETIDYVLITHNHQDHCMFETLLQLRHRIRNILVPKNNGGGLTDPSLKLILRQVGFSNVREVDELESVECAGGSITGLPFFGEHGDLDIRSKLAFLVNLKGRSVLCAADSNNIEPKLYEHLHAITGDVDIVFIGMECDGGPLSWLYGPLLTKALTRKVDQSRRLNGSNYERGIDIIERLRPKQVYVYAMGQEPWLTFLTSIQYTEESRPIIDSNRLVEDCGRRTLGAERLFGHKEIFI
jgi:L-ascorbate metabolism protein UlaG (beta-lactamase superfamily)